MSKENVEIVRRSFDLWSEGSLDEWAQAFDPEVVVQPPDGWPEGEVRGLDAWLRQAERLRDRARPAAGVTAMEVAAEHPLAAGLLD